MKCRQFESITKMNLSFCYTCMSIFFKIDTKNHFCFTFNGILGESSARPTSSKTTTDAKRSRSLFSWSLLACWNVFMIPSAVAKGLHWKEMIWTFKEHKCEYCTVSTINSPYRHRAKDLIVQPCAGQSDSPLWVQTILQYITIETNQKLLRNIL